MKGRLIVACVCVVLIFAGGSSAGDGSEESGSGAPAAVAAVAVFGAVGGEDAIKPWIHPSMPKGVRTKLEAGFELAVACVREIESCGDLFSELGADGLKILNTGLYLPVDSYRREVEVCGRNPATNSTGAGILAYTKVGGAPTWICRHFARVSAETAAVAVIHEALHHAGLIERPRDRMGMTSVEITDMVRKRCGFRDKGELPSPIILVRERWITQGSTFNRLNAFSYR